jgi:heme/copper-type cytochrome/quinol oxidase subunit 1
MLGFARWPSGTPVLTINIKNRLYGFSPDYWAFTIGAIFAVFAAVYYWIPIVFSRSLSSRMSHIHFWLSALAAFGFLVLAPGLQAFSAPRSATLSEERTVIATLLIATLSELAFLVAQVIFVAGWFWNAFYGKNI